MGLFPETIFVRTDFAIDMGQLMPKQTSIVASKMLMVSIRFSDERREAAFGASATIC